MESRTSLLENLYKPFFKNKNSHNKAVKQSIPSNNQNVDKTLSNTETDYERYTLGYFEDNSGLLFNRKDNATLINKQNDLIKRYRRAAMTPEVASAIEEITNEMAFVVDNETVVTLDISERLEVNDKVKEAFINNFNDILQLMNFNFNADSILKQFYIDGQLRFGCSYNNKGGDKGIKSGIAAIHILSPINLFYHDASKLWKYYTQQSNDSGFNIKFEDSEQNIDLVLSDEELVTIDSGLYGDGLILSHLHTTLKTINQLNSLEDMLIPLRFSRSVSRRVFNIDVGDLPYAKAMQAVKDIQDKFKYKKYYDVENGQISNTASVATIVEDYYFPSRGGKGTSIDVLDESGNLGELGDIEYFQKKLYSSLKVPLGRLTGSDKATVYDYSGSQIEQDEIKFFAFINRIRQRFNQGLLDILKRHMVAKGLLTVKEFNDYKQHLIVRWEKESNFLERQKLELLKSKLELYSEVKEYIGDIYSKTWVLKNILNMSEDEIIQMRKEMEQEELGELALTQPDNEEGVADTTGNTGDIKKDTEGNKEKQDKPEKPEESDSEKLDLPEKPEDTSPPEFGGTFSNPSNP
jgi:hypothetical protein